MEKAYEFDFDETMWLHSFMLRMFMNKYDIGLTYHYAIGVKFILNFVYFSAKLWKNMQGRFRGTEVIYTVYFTGSRLIFQDIILLTF